ncbi:MAG: hypothetical protein OFPI_11160 [Osedax symbiont Rs2]|nr:MAG: hypothetical protein OFPI_11160 [Osedax symbiont Rs2]
MGNLKRLATVLCYSLLLWQLPSMANNLDEVSLLTEGYPPYNYQGENGELQGIAVELLVAAYKHSNIDFDKSTIKLQPWPRAYRSVLQGTNTMLFSMTRTLSREKLFKWAGPISKTRVVLLAKKTSHVVISTPDDLTQYIIGGIRNDIGLLLVRELVADSGQLLTSPYASSLANMLNLGRIDLWAYEENVAAHFLRREGLDPSDFEAVYTLSEAQLYYAFSINTEQNIVDGLQSILDQFRSATKSTDNP